MRQKAVIGPPRKLLTYKPPGSGLAVAVSTLDGLYCRGFFANYQASANPEVRKPKLRACGVGYGFANGLGSGKQKPQSFFLNWLAPFPIGRRVWHSFSHCSRQRY